MHRKINDGLREVASSFDTVSQQLFQISRQLEKSEEYNVEEKMVGLVRVAETSCVELRNYAARTVNPDTCQLYANVSEAMGISVEEHQKWIKITVPSILPGRKKRDNHIYLTRPLRNALIDFQRENPLERFGECAICIVHQYDESLGCRRVRDYDNIETKRYLDVIESILLTNDGGLLCTVLQSTEMGDKDATMFYLMQPETLTRWVQERVKTHTKS